MNTYFPHPSVQAMFLLDQTENDLPTAIEMALMNTRKEDREAVSFWVAVVDALTPKAQVS